MIYFKALTKLSTHCQQGISHNCNNNPLTGFSSWTDINNVRNQYWHGHHEPNTVGCSCLLDDSCGINSNQKCNCDTYKMNASDSGFLSSKSKLPVMQLHYGGSVSKISRIIYQLEPMICTGKSGVYPSEATKSALEKLVNADISIASRLDELQDEFSTFRNESQEMVKVKNGFQFEKNEIFSKSVKKKRFLKMTFFEKFDQTKASSKIRYSQASLKSWGPFDRKILKSSEK